MRGRQTVEALVATINARNVPGMIVGEGDVWIAEATLDYGGGAVYQTVFIFEMREGEIATETAYWAEPFPAPDRHAAWVEHLDD